MLNKLKCPKCSKVHEVDMSPTEGRVAQSRNEAERFLRLELQCDCGTLIPYTRRTV